MINVDSVGELVAAYGSEAERHLLSCCLSAVDQAAAGTGDSSRDRDVAQLLLDCFGPLVNQPSFPSLVAAEPAKSPLAVAHLSRQLRLTTSQEVVLRIASLDLSDAGDSDSPESLSAVRQKLGELLSALVAPAEGHSCQGLEVPNPLYSVDQPTFSSRVVTRSRRPR